MNFNQLIEAGLPADHEILMQGRDQGECGPVGTVGCVYRGKRGGINVIMATGPNALRTINVHKETQFTFQRVISGLS